MKQKRNKKYNPAKSLNRAMLHQAGRCYLYRWETAKGGNGEFCFSGHETMSRDAQEQALSHVMARQTQWVVLIHACFVAGTEYYEETCEFVTPPVALASNAEMVDELIQAAAEEARIAGNPAHYIDTVVVLRPATERFRAMADDDEWHKRQAAYRSRLILESVGVAA